MGGSTPQPPVNSNTVTQTRKPVRSLSYSDGQADACTVSYSIHKTFDHFIMKLCLKICMFVFFFKQICSWCFDQSHLVIFCGIVTTTCAATCCFVTSILWSSWWSNKTIVDLLLANNADFILCMASHKFIFPIIYAFSSKLNNFPYLLFFANWNKIYIYSYLWIL